MQLRWRIALLVSAAIAISYLDRQTLPIAIGEIQREFPISNSVKAWLDSAFLLTYGLMYVGGGRLMDVLGTQRGFLVIMIFWSLACASHGFAGGVVALAASRLLLGVGEGGGFPAATRVVAEWFPAKDRATAMGLINAGTGVGGVIAPPLIAGIILHVHWLGASSWRWVFFITGALGLVWVVGWLWSSRAMRIEGIAAIREVARPVPMRELLRFRETWGVIGAKFLSDAAWYFYMFWLPKYLLDARGFNIKAVGSVAWIPFGAAALGCLVGGGLSSWLLHRGYSVNAARKIALGLSAALMPGVMLVPHVPVPWVIFLFSVAFFGQQSWSTLVMTLPTDLFPKHALGTVAGFVGLGGALGGVVMGQLAGWLLDRGFSYTPVLVIAGSLHVAAFLVILATVRSLQPLPVSPAGRAPGIERGGAMSGATRPAGEHLRFGCCGSMIAPAVDPVGGDIVEDLAALGYDYIELSLRDLVALPAAALAALSARLQRAGLTCEACNNFFPPEIRLTGPAVDAGAALRYAEQALATAAGVGAAVVIFGSSGARNVPPGFPADLAWAQLRTLLRAIAPFAERHGISIAIEHLHRGESNILNTIAETWRMAREVAHPRVRLLVDAYHLRIEAESPAILAEVAPAIAHVHVAEDSGRRFPTVRDDMLADFFAHLRALGYVQRCSIEAHTTDFVADAAQALRVCRQLSAAVMT